MTTSDDKSEKAKEAFVATKALSNGPKLSIKEALAAKHAKENSEFLLDPLDSLFKKQAPAIRPQGAMTSVKAQDTKHAQLSDGANEANDAQDSDTLADNAAKASKAVAEAQIAKSNKSSKSSKSSMSSQGQANTDFLGHKTNKSDKNAMESMANQATEDHNPAKPTKAVKDRLSVKGKRAKIKASNEADSESYIETSAIAANKAKKATKTSTSSVLAADYVPFTSSSSPVDATASKVSQVYFANDSKSTESAKYLSLESDTPSVKSSHLEQATPKYEVNAKVKAKANVAKVSEIAENTGDSARKITKSNKATKSTKATKDASALATATTSKDAADSNVGANANNLSKAVESSDTVEVKSFYAELLKVNDDWALKPIAVGNKSEAKAVDADSSSPSASASATAGTSASTSALSSEGSAAGSDACSTSGSAAGSASGSTEGSSEGESSKSNAQHVKKAKSHLCKDNSSLEQDFSANAEATVGLATVTTTTTTSSLSLSTGSNAGKSNERAQAKVNAASASSTDADYLAAKDSAEDCAASAQCKGTGTSVEKDEVDAAALVKERMQELFTSSKVYPPFYLAKSEEIFDRLSSLNSTEELRRDLNELWYLLVDKALELEGEARSHGFLVDTSVSVLSDDPSSLVEVLANPQDFVHARKLWDFGPYVIREPDAKQIALFDDNDTLELDGKTAKENRLNERARLRKSFKEKVRAALKKGLDPHKLETKSTFLFDSKQFLKTVPNRPGCYLMYNLKDVVIYVGKAKDLKKRLSSYFVKNVNSLKTRALVSHIHHIEFTVTFSESEALILENELIKKFQPRYNILLRDDKSYPFIRLSTDHKHPGIYFHRGARNKGGEYFGPFPDSTAVRDSLRFMEKVFPIRQCDDFKYSSRTRPCLVGQMGKCLAPCVAMSEEAERAYLEQVSLVKLFLKGQNQALLKELSAKMEEHAIAMEFEQAALLRDQITSLRHVQTSNSIVSDIPYPLDVIAHEFKNGMCCMHVLFIRDGRIFGTRSYFPKFNANTDERDVVISFLTQFYLNDSHSSLMPKVVVVDIPQQETPSLKLSTSLGDALDALEAKLGTLQPSSAPADAKASASASATADAAVSTAADAAASTTATADAVATAMAKSAFGNAAMVEAAIDNESLSKADAIANVIANDMVASSTMGKATPLVSSTAGTGSSSMSCSMRGEKELTPLQEAFMEAAFPYVEDDDDAEQSLDAANATMASSRLSAAASQQDGRDNDNGAVPNAQGDDENAASNATYNATSGVVGAKAELKLLSNTIYERYNKRVRFVSDVRGSKARFLQLASENAKASLKAKLSSSEVAKRRIEDLEELLGISGVERMECYDISHTLGKETVGSCVVFNREGPDTSQYRRYNITGITPGDDYAAMHQVLTRRFRNPDEGELPDIIFVDGGKGQLSQAEAALDEAFSGAKAEKPLMIAVTKGEGRKLGLETLVKGYSREVIDIDPSSPAFLLALHIRDESHRFAITGHRNKRDKINAKSPLDEIVGLGPKRRQALIKSLGGMVEVRAASVAELSKVEGISKSMAQKIYDALH